MSKNIILLSDGTGNSAHDPFKTNVWRLYQALDLNGSALPHSNDRVQVACYDDGVGTSSFQPLAILGGAFGYGVKRNVLDLYTFLCRNYKTAEENPDKQADQIYCFGFSRGAFTVRVLAGLIGSQGLVRAKTEAELQRLARDAFRAYRRRYHTGRHWLNPFNWLAHLWQALRDVALRGWNKLRGRAQYDAVTKSAARIRFLGVWDTVAAYGLPIDELTRAWDAVFPLSFPNRELSVKVDRACHALALDDERHSFHPELWTEVEAGETAATKPLHDRLLQVWFAGMHSDVGGSYPDDAMSFVPLEWMLGEAEIAGLRFKQAEKDSIKAAANVRGPLHDSRRGTGGFYRYRPRKLAELVNDKEADVIVPRPKIHASVFERIHDGTDGYAPIVLPAKYALYTRQGEILWCDKNGQSQQADGAGHNKIQKVTYHAGTPLPEQPMEAELRAQRQEHIWNLVWWKRGWYFLSVLTAFALALFPLYRPATSACENGFCFAAPFIRAVAFVLPGFAAPLLKAYESHPGSFLLMLGVFLLALGKGASLQRKISDGMRLIWANDPLPQHVVPPVGGLFGLRTSDAYQAGLKFVRNKVLVPLAGLVAVWVLGGLATHFAFTVLESSGCVCSKSVRPEQELKATATAFEEAMKAVIRQHKTDSARYELALACPACSSASAGTTPPSGTEPPALVLPDWPTKFDPKSPCWASGYWMEEGKRYKLTLKASADWADAGIKSDIGGFEVKDDFVRWPSKLGLYGGFWLRRHLGEEWFNPMARIGHTGHDEYPLNAQGSLASNVLVAEFSARRSGELYLFVNDAALPVPNRWQKFYLNNIGAATVQIQRLDEEGK